METYGWQNSYFASNWLVYTLDKGNKNLNKNKKRFSGSEYHRLTNPSLMAQSLHVWTTHGFLLNQSNSKSWSSISEDYAQK